MIVQATDESIKVQKESSQSQYSALHYFFYFFFIFFKFQLLLFSLNSLFLQASE